MSHLSLNTDTCSLSGPSISVLVSCAPLAASWELPDSRPQADRQNPGGGVSGWIDLDSPYGAGWISQVEVGVGEH